MPTPTFIRSIRTVLIRIRFIRSSCIEIGWSSGKPSWRHRLTRCTIVERFRPIGRIKWQQHGAQFSIPSRGRSLERTLHVRHSWLYQSPVFANSGSSFRNHIRVGQWLSIFSTRGSCECQLLSIAYFRAIIPEAAVVPLCIVMHSGSLAGEAGSTSVSCMTKSAVCRHFISSFPFRVWEFSCSCGIRELSFRSPMCSCVA